MKEVERLVEALHPLERTLLPAIDKETTLQELGKKTNLQLVEITRALQWLENKQLVTLTKEEKELVVIDSNGQLYCEKGLPEKRFLQVLEQPLTLDELREKADLDHDEAAMSIGVLKRKNAIQLNEKIRILDQGKKLLQEGFKEEQFLKELPKNLSTLSHEEKNLLNELRRRKQLIQVIKEKTLTASITDLGKQVLSLKPSTDLIEALTPAILKSGSWKGKKFRRYNLGLDVPKVYPGKRHFVNQAIEYIRRIWLDLGFKEMTGPLIDTAFWNFDALFVPQDHPAREMQDTFFIDGKGSLPSKELVKKVQQTHEKGWTTGSTGWQYKWNPEKAKELVLRTHTTILSARTIASLKQADLPAKYFSVAKCFRNEAVDWKHAFEFNQIEGIVVDEHVTFKHLLGYLKEYYAKLGITKIRFRPSFFPYTELSVECDYFHPERKEWVEFGGAGMFRPEVVKPLLGKDVPVLAWGQGMERAIMEYYQITNMRDLYKNDLKQLRQMKMWMK